jgi:uncharacterized protein
MSQGTEISVLSGMDQIPAAEWDLCAGAVDPFVSHRFLLALETSDSVGPGTGWTPHHLVARQEGQIIAVAALYGKSHSQGEYVFDHSWARALENAGGQYYPKLQIAVPFTPVAGRRLLTRPKFEVVGQSALIQGAVQLAAGNELSSLHITFCTEAEADAGEAMGLLRREDQQFHWENNGYVDFGAFLAALSARKRKQIRKERKQAQTFGGEIICLTGDAIEPHHWDAFWRFYQDTGSRKWGQPYLTRDFFNQVQATMRDDVMLVLALRDGVPVAGALNFIGKTTLYGRYWGCTEHHPCLHFELCYYQAMDWAITHGLARVEAGAQGEHKLARGYLPNRTNSLHWISEPGFREAVADYLEQERAAVGQDIEILTSYGPFKNTPVDE